MKKKKKSILEKRLESYVEALRAENHSLRTALEVSESRCDIAVITVHGHRSKTAAIQDEIKATVQRLATER